MKRGRSESYIEDKQKHYASLRIFPMLFEHHVAYNYNVFINHDYAQNPSSIYDSKTGFGTRGACIVISWYHRYFVTNDKYIKPIIV